jgi:hypothetical protein
MLIVSLYVIHSFRRDDGEDVSIFVLGCHLDDAVDVMQINDAEELIFLNDETKAE